MNGMARILIVDDDAALGAAVSLVFRAGRFAEVVHTTNAEDAYALLGLDEDCDGCEPRFDVILLDLMMPGIDGIEACARIRTTRCYRDVPILMFSGMNEIESLNQAFLAGANDFLSKPVKNFELLARVRSAMQLKRELDRRRAREAELLKAARKDMPTITGLVDDETGIPSKEGFAVAMRRAAGSERTYGLLALRLTDVPGLRQEAGEDAVRALVARAAAVVMSLPAPLGWLLFNHGEGLFMVAARDATAQQVALLGRQIQAAVSLLPVPHREGEPSDGARIEFASATGHGSDLLTLPAELIRSLDTPEPEFYLRGKAA